MNGYPVRAAERIEFRGGMVLADEGQRGTALLGVKPNRKHHYGLVPVRWKGRQRAFWVEIDKLKSRHNLTRCITPLPPKECELEVPRSATAGVLHFGRNLRMFRKARELSQEQLAAAMAKKGLGRVSQTGISNWESRSDCPNGRFVEVASRVLDVPAFAFFVPLDCVRISDCLDYVGDLQRLICAWEAHNV